MRLTSPPSPVRRARLDNIALVPASLLPFKSHYQAIANRLPRNDILIVLPAVDDPPTKVLRTVTTLLRAKGYAVTTVTDEQLRGVGEGRCGRKVGMHRTSSSM